MSEIKWRVYEPEGSLEEFDRVYVAVDRLGGHERYRQLSGYCSREEFEDLKRRLEGEPDEDVLADMEAVCADGDD